MTGSADARMRRLQRGLLLRDGAPFTGEGLTPEEKLALIKIELGEEEDDQVTLDRDRHFETVARDVGLSLDDLADDLDAAISTDDPQRPPSAADIVAGICGPQERARARALAKVRKALRDAVAAEDVAGKAAWRLRRQLAEAEDQARHAKARLAEARTAERDQIAFDTAQRAAHAADRAELEPIVTALLAGQPVRVDQIGFSGEWRLKDGRVIDSKGRDFKPRSQRYEGRA